MYEQKTYRLPGAIRINFRCAPVTSALSLIYSIFTGILPALYATVIASFIDTALAIAGGARAYDEIWLPLLLGTGLVAVEWLSGNLANLLGEHRRLKVLSQFRVDIVEKCARLSYEHVENPETWDLITKVAKDPDEQITGAYNEVLGAMNLGLKIASIIALLMAQVWWAALLIVGFSAPLVWMALKSGKANYQAQRDAERATRKSNYLRDILTNRESAEERALFGYSASISREYMAQFLSAYRTRFKTQLKWFVRMKLGSSIFAFISVLVALVLLQPAMSGAITVGMFMSLVTQVFGLVQQMSWGLTWYMDQMAKRSEYLKDMTRFAALEECPGTLDAPMTPPLEFQSLEFRDLHFTYPGTEREILSGLTIRLEAGRHYAFVGVNGAGKTTLTKLLTGLYGQYEGEILLNGRDLRSYSQSELKSLYSLAYQDFARYFVSLKDTIALGWPDREARLDATIHQVGLDDAVTELPKGANTPLGKILDEGTDISGGQWQRVAIARALVSPAPVRILDEPTAALDPISESDIYHEFKRMSQGVTTLFISHRLGSTLLADRIFVIGEGRVLEQGDHEELMALHGLYAEMYEAQRSWYQ